jgi:Zn-dependent metalloprotease
MKKFLLLSALLPLSLILKAQDIDKNKAFDLVQRNTTAIGLTENDLKNVLITNAYVSNPSGLELVYLQQSHMGLPVFNQMHVLAFKNGVLVSKSGGRIAEIQKNTNTNNPVPAVSAENAVRIAMTNKKVTTQNIPSGAILVPGRKFDFGKLNTYENVTAELMWVPMKNDKQVIADKQVILAWQIYLVPEGSSDYWLIRVNAITNQIIGETNLTVYCNWKTPAANQSVDKKHNHATSGR